MLTGDTSFVVWRGICRYLDLTLLLPEKLQYGKKLKNTAEKTIHLFLYINNFRDWMTAYKNSLAKCVKLLISIALLVTHFDSIGCSSNPSAVDLFCGSGSKHLDKKFKNITVPHSAQYTCCV